MKRLSALLLALLLIVVSVSGCFTTNEERLAQFERDLAVFQEYIESIGNASYTNDQSINQLEYDLDSLTEYIYGYDPANSSYPGGFWNPPKDVPSATAYVLSTDVPARIRAAARGMKQVYGDLIQICNGVNDHVEMQAAVDALPATGGDAWYSEGTFYVEVSLVQDSYQTWRGCGRSTIFTTTTADLDIITATGGAGTEKVGILIADLTIDGATISDVGITFTYVDQSSISNIYVSDVGDIGIYLINSDHNNISDNVYLNGSSYGIDIEASNNNIINANQIEGSQAEAILLDSTSSGNTLTANIIYDNYNGIYVTLNSVDNTISGNACEANGVGIYVRGDYNVVVSNICSNNDSQGIVVTSAAFTNVSDNTCRGNDQQGIAVVVATDTLVGNNICVGNSQVGDELWANILIDDSTNTLVIGNICRHGGGANQPDYGLKIEGAISDCIVLGNDLTDGGKTGALFDEKGGHATTIGSNNQGIDMHQIKEFVYAKNTSGGELPTGSVVRHKAVAAGNEFDVPTANGEDSILGMLIGTTGNDEWAYVQVAGRVSYLRATNDGGAISIGDYLCTENGSRARLAGAGDMAFARALEACDVANLSLDARIISPIKIGHASQTFEFSFVDGTLYDDMGWDIDLGAEYATAFAQIPEDVASITLMRIWAYSVVAEADAMRLEISMNGAGDNEAWNTHAYAGANVPSASTNFGATDIIYWEITDAAVLALTASDSVVVKVLYEDAGNGDCATDARFRCVEFEYE